MSTLPAIDAVVNALFNFSFRDAVGWTASGVALALYVLLIYHFYQFVAKRDIFEKHLTFTHPGVVGLLEDIILGFLRLVKYGIMFPIISFVWFLGFSALLFVIVQNQTLEQTTLVAIALITGARVLSYYRKDAAQELAKTLPIVILGAALIEPNFFHFDQLYTRLFALPGLSITLLHFVVYLSGLEMVLRFLLYVKLAIWNDPLSQSTRKK
ncbi:MAG: hypothetical protein FJY86_04255 [Candidatus Diapherotrites archaeon]|uniref:Uncharacterized protein n=1 Tax=Candidatus Iainarchaeum sp. TaxID=3101447 RepID=A0A8T4C7U7_9ARCH|nr:hypothetical protein [Candidatus Diapherotrites archaeon]